MFAVKQATEPDPLTSAAIKARARHQDRLADAIGLASRNLPPALARLVFDELIFHVHATWLGCPPNLLAVIDELRDMDTRR